ncbi:1-acyl-sn-glycerol-3-phosphate acyltransferase [Candidatus Liberibacter sp.]|uniref:lysophospholipid acyltransferase family protein n=1 Tax=Candidatus Liberibacter sp. TaxID=34022 RepID=UPI0015F41F75|nr:lysophospholipid acyltransferase family protein [Candidatus Liberibacter sp.]MBA5724012.1 1-acyl-sn-glycerol-3-phosphate acyltransferase [Candidatus Liberibacter sp.]
MILIRSIIFNILFCINILLAAIISIPLWLLSTKKQFMRFARIWVNIQQLLLKYVTKTCLKVEGLEHIPPKGCIIAIKHQSSWDTIFFLTCLNDPIFIVKRSIFYIPLFGWYCFRLGMIGVDRNSKRIDMRNIIKRSQKTVEQNRQLVIYPEGTRRPPGAKTIYKKGIAHIYNSLSVPVIPIVVHAGLFWPHKGFMRYPGNFKVRILPPIPPGMPKEDFFAKLQDNMEYESKKLLLETIQENPHLPLPISAKTTYEKLLENHTP